MLQGSITKIVVSRGYGFIAGDHRDVFFHCSCVRDTSFRELAQGQTVVYELDDDHSANGQDQTRHPGLRAAFVRPA